MTTADGAPDDRAVAVVDCGTNTTRLLLAHVRATEPGSAERRGGAAEPGSAERVFAGRVEQARRRTEVTRLGAGVDQTGRLSDAALLRVTAVLDRYATEWRAEGVTRVAVCATSAVRDAVNASAFVDAVEEVTGVVPVVLAGDDEAALTFAGVVAGRRNRQVVCDVGGGSTELVAGTVTPELLAGADTPEHRASLPVGSVRLRERHLVRDPPTPDEYAALIADADAVLAEQPDVYAAAADTTPVAVAGTAVTLAAVAMGVGPDDVEHIDGARMTTDDLHQHIEDLAWVPARERLAHPAIVPGREDVIVAGALLLARVAHRFAWREIEVRVGDLLDGIALRLAAGRWPPASGQVPA